MKEFLEQSWWMLVLRGVIAVLFGVLALTLPGLTLLALVILFAAYALMGGAVSIYAAWKNRDHDSKWWIVLLLGVLSIAAGLLAIWYPAMTVLVLVVVMGANALVTGVLDIWIATRLRNEVSGKWMLLLAGGVSVVFGVFVLIFPSAGALALVWLISIQAIVIGILLMSLGFSMRAAGKPREPAHA